MSQIKRPYWIIFGIIILFTIYLGYINWCNLKTFDSNIVNLIIAILALSVSILAMGLSDKKLKPLEIDLKTWVSTHRAKKEAIPANLTKIVFNIENSGREPIKDLLLNFRCPKEVLDLESLKESNFRFHSYGDTLIASNDSVKFIGTVKKDDSIKFEFLLDFNKWSKNNIYLSFSAHDSISSTFCIKFGMKEQVLESNSSKPITLIQEK